MNSDQIKIGVDRAPNRSLLYALGLTEEELNRPIIGIVSSYNEIVPGHMHLDKIAEAVKAGVRAAGGTPILFPAIAVCDGIAMGHEGMKSSLASREVIADSVELTMRGHCYDALVGLAGCSADCADMWQIGVDVLPEYRRKGIASALTGALAKAAMERGKVPFYCSAWSNVRSVRNAVKSGFIPAWVEMTATPAHVVEEMNKETGKR